MVEASRGWAAVFVPGGQAVNELRVCIDARLVSGQLGGVEQTIIGLAHGFSQLADGDEVYYFLVQQGMDDWILPYLQNRCRPLYTAVDRSGPVCAGWRSRLRSELRRGWHTLAPLAGARAVPLHPSDGTIEQAGIDVMHFAAPVAFRTAIPSLYQIQDMQHRVLPENFSRYERLARNVQYQTYMAQARLVSVATSWGRSELLAHFTATPPARVVVVPYGPAPAAHGPISAAESHAVAHQLALPDAYLFYPAQTWRHKNHLMLLQALAHLRDAAGIVLPLICSGRLNEFYRTIQQAVQELHLANQVQFLGFVAPEAMRVLYDRCRAVVFPSRYEGFGMPVLEAFQYRRPLACARIPLLAEVVGDAALLFDRDDAVDMARALLQIWFDMELREYLCARGSERVAQFDWARTARIFRAYHRRIAGRELTENDHRLLATAPVV